MSTTLGWKEIGLRLLLTVIAGVLVGIDRGIHGRPVGLRTTVLVCLAASISMIQANVLLPMIGKTDGSFVTLDLMRLPLGILTGMGFIVQRDPQERRPGCRYHDRCDIMVYHRSRPLLGRRPARSRYDRLSNRPRRA